MLCHKSKTLLKESRNLLAFSAGVDSTALFFLLLEAGITFDIAIVDYALRQESKEEVAYAQELAKRYDLRCHLHSAPQITKNFEATARSIRYDFFESLIKRYNYTTLITAHHLGDRFEWFLMQFCKGAGCLELQGLQTIEKRTNYHLVRPLLEQDKSDLLAYLHAKDIRYFQDSSNSDERYSRNYFRKHHAQPLLQKYKKGIRASFAYMQKDNEILLKEITPKEINQLAYFEVSNTRSTIYTIDKYLKSYGHIMSHAERQLLEKKRSVVIGRKYIVTQIGEYIFIAPFVKKEKLPKDFKEQMRKLGIDPKLRPYLFEDSEAVNFLSLLLA